MQTERKDSPIPMKRNDLWQSQESTLSVWRQMLALGSAGERRGAMAFLAGDRAAGSRSAFYRLGRRAWAQGIAAPSLAAIRAALHPQGEPPAPAEGPKADGTPHPSKGTAYTP